MLAGEVGPISIETVRCVGKLKADGFKRFRVGGVATTGQGLGLGLGDYFVVYGVGVEGRQIHVSQAAPRGSIIEFGGEVQ